MFNGVFEEATSQRATFPEDHPVAFKLLIGWVYTGFIEIPKSSDDDGSEEHPSTHLLRLFVLAEKLMIPRLADATMDLLTKYCKAIAILPHRAVMDEEYRQTPDDSKLRLWVARAMVHQFRFTSHDTYEKGPLKEMLADNVDLLGDFLGNMRVLEPDCSSSFPSEPWEFPACDYHQHTKSEPCPYAKKK